MPRIIVFGHSWGHSDSPIIFTRNFITREDHWRITSLVTKEFLFTASHRLFCIVRKASYYDDFMAWECFWCYWWWLSVIGEMIVLLLPLLMMMIIIISIIIIMIIITIIWTNSWLVQYHDQYFIDVMSSHLVVLSALLHYHFHSYRYVYHYGCAYHDNNYLLVLKITMSINKLKKDVNSVRCVAAYPMRFIHFVWRKWHT